METVRKRMEKQTMKENVLRLLNEICEDFGPYCFLKTDLYKGKIIGGHNLYVKKGESEKEGVIIGKRDIEKFDLGQIPTNFVAYTNFNQKKAEYGWTDDKMVEVLEQISRRIKEENLKA